MITSPPFLTSLPALTAVLRANNTALFTYLDQLETRFEQLEPTVLAFVPENGRFPRLRQQAQQLIAQYPSPDSRPPLFGVPIAVKDIFHVEGFTTRAGSQLPPDALQGDEAESVRLLKQAGALILGKAVTTEFAFFAPGPTRNPHNPAHTPGGSSSGSAAAVAAGLAPLAFGTQTIGSINRPAAFCGVVGYKPSYERISRAGVIPLSPSLDHVGLFAADSAGVGVVVGLLCQHWQTAVPRRKPILGIPQGAYLEKASPEGLAHFQKRCEWLERAGYVLRPVPCMPDFERIYDRHYLVTAADAAQVHAPWFAQFEPLYHAKTADLIRKGQAVSSEQLAEAKNGRFTLRQQLTELMEIHQIDLWITPAAPGAAPKGLDSTGNPVMNLPWTHAGLPTLTLPAGFNGEGMPLGLQLIGRWYQDEALLAWAGELEGMSY